MLAQFNLGSIPQRLQALLLQLLAAQLGHGHCAFGGTRLGNVANAMPKALHHRCKFPAEAALLLGRGASGASSRLCCLQRIQQADCPSYLALQQCKFSGFALFAGDVLVWLLRTYICSAAWQFVLLPACLSCWQGSCSAASCEPVESLWISRCFCVSSEHAGQITGYIVCTVGRLASVCMFIPRSVCLKHGCRGGRQDWQCA
ncbi:hypothetical protein COO60DRAFT_322834 [Scenedesmus sp. NREL 46B-D3]|nr:hypothetical protein COO60DRAFT_322834 [Scenedesmus sp. NREL 46B-D3]